MSALEGLLTAANQDSNACRSVHTHPCPSCIAKRDLAALAPDMARAGQALAELLGPVHLHDTSWPCNEGCPIAQALATWNALGKAEEGRDG